MIVIDQHKIDNTQCVPGGGFPRSQEWWTRFAGVGTTATVRDDGIVTLEPNGQYYDYAAWMDDPVHQAHRPCDGSDCPIAERKLTAVQRRHAEARLAQRFNRLELLRPAIVGRGVTDASR
jgi:hypothetical protein